MRIPLGVSLVLACLLAFAKAGTLAAVQEGNWHTIDRASVASDGTLADDGPDSQSHVSVSGGGRFVAFQSGATNLVAGDDAGHQDVFLRDREEGTTVRISVSPDGEDGDASSRNPAVTPDGQFVVFNSHASNLVPNDDNGKADVFVWKRQSGAIELVSVATDGTQVNDHSALPASGGSTISDDGRYVVFSSGADNLVQGDANEESDIFVRDRESGTTDLVSRASDGSQGNGRSFFPTVSGDGRIVAFGTLAGNLVGAPSNDLPQIVFRNLQTGATGLVSAAPGSSDVSLSTDGRLAVFVSLASDLAPSDDNGQYDVFLRDLQTQTTELVSVSTGGVQGVGDTWEPSMSGDGRFIAFESISANLVADDENGLSDIFVRDRELHTTEIVSLGADAEAGDSSSYDPAINQDGRFVVFLSNASNLVAGDNDVPHYLVAQRTVSSVLVQGDVDCDRGITSRDNQALLRKVLGQPPLSQTEQCPALGDVVGVGGTDRVWGDLDCDGEITSRDGQALLRRVLQQQPLSQTQPCVPIGDGATVVTGAATQVREHSTWGRWGLW